MPKGISSVAAAAKLCAVVRSSLVELRGPESLASSLYSDWSLCMTKEDLERPLPIVPKELHWGNRSDSDEPP